MTQRGFTWQFEGQDAGLGATVLQISNDLGAMGAKGAQAYNDLTRATERYAQADAQLQRQLQAAEARQRNALSPAKEEAATKAVESLESKRLAAFHRMEAAEDAYAARSAADAEKVAQAAGRKAAAIERESRRAAEAHNASIDKMGNKIANFVTTTAGMLAANAITGLFQGIASGAKEAAAAVVNDTADMQQAMVTYTRQLGSAKAARDELAQVKLSATQVPQDLPAVIDLDQKLLARFHSMSEIEARFGTTMAATRTTILDTGAALKLSDEQLQRIAIDLQEVGSGQNVGRALQSLALITGVTKEELGKQGVQFDQNGTHIISSYTEATRAVMTVLNTHYGGMAALQSQTFNGMKANLGDLTRIFSTELGEKSVGVATKYIAGYIKTVTEDPNFIPTLRDWGDKMARVTDATFRMFNEIVKDAGVAAQAIRPVTDALGDLIGRLPASDASLPWDNMAKGADSFLGNLDEIQQQQEANKEGLYKAEDALTNNSRAVQTLKENYDKLLEPLREKERMDDRAYARGNESIRLAKLNREITRDQALGKDLYSSEGRSAAMRLVGELAEREQLQREISHNAEKATTQDKITNLEKRQKAGETAYAHARNTLEDNLKALQRDSSAVHDHTIAVTQDADREGQAWRGLATTATTATDDIRTTLADQANAYTKRTRAVSTDLSVFTANLKSFVSFVVETDTIIGTVLGHTFDTIGRAVTETSLRTQIAQQQIYDVTHLIDQSQDTVLKGLQDQLKVSDIVGKLKEKIFVRELNAETATMGKGYQTMRDAVQGTQIPTNPYDPTHVQPPKGPPANSPPHPGPDFGPSGQVNLKLLVGGKEMAAVITDELGNPLNARTLLKTLSYGTGGGRRG